MPCQAYLSQLWEAHDDLAARGASSIAVGGSAAYQAEWLATDEGIAMPLLLDPDQTFRSAVEFGDLTLRQILFDRKGIASYMAAMKGGARQKKITADTVRSPGVVILDEQLEVRWSHEGTTLGDYPPIPAVLAALDGLAATS